MRSEPKFENEDYSSCRRSLATAATAVLQSSRQLPNNFFGLISEARTNRSGVSVRVLKNLPTTLLSPLLYFQAQVLPFLLSLIFMSRKSWYICCHSQPSSVLKYISVPLSNTSPLFLSSTLSSNLSLGSTVESYQPLPTRLSRKTNPPHSSPFFNLFLYFLFRFLSLCCLPALPRFFSHLPSTPSYSFHAQQRTTSSRTFCHLSLHSPQILPATSKLIKQFSSILLMPFAHKLNLQIHAQM